VSELHDALTTRLTLQTGVLSDLFRERTAAQLLGGAAAPDACLAAGCSRGLAWTTLPVRVSSAHGGAAAVFLSAGVAATRLVVDESATDTVTNFTTSVAPLRRAGACHVAVLTSASHARRSAAVAVVALGACGIAASVVPLSEAGAGSAPRPESAARVARDVLRAALWALTGVHGGALGRLLHPERFNHLDAAAAAARRRR
jgi:hypothetical protein